MRRIFDIAKWGITLGREPQAFLGAKWVNSVLDHAPTSRKRGLALRLLSLSPHYFINPDAPEYKGLRNSVYLEKVFQDCLDSRKKIYDQILKGRLRPDDIVIDYGCGPGFVAKAVAPHVGKVFACDISTGALACARVLNAEQNIEYVTADEKGLSKIEDESIDLVISFAMVQHISDDIFELVLDNCRRKLKPNGRLILHIQLIDNFWRTEDDWKNDISVQGKLKYRYGLHCFGRTEESHRQLVAKYGFEDINFENLSDVVSDNFDDVCSQSLLTAVKGV